MTLSRTQRKALQRALANLSTEPIATFVEALFPTKFPTSHRAPLVDATTKLFSEYWTGAAGQEALVPVHYSLNLFVYTFTKWQVDFQQAEALAAHTAKIQAHLTTLEEKIANPVEDNEFGNVFNIKVVTTVKDTNGATLHNA